MKTIILVRHATAEDMKEGVSEISRSLVKEGVKEAKSAAKFIKERISGDSESSIFISSPADRALETAHIFANKTNYPAAKILIKEMIYSDPLSESFLTMIHELPDSYNTAVVFGHNPSISEWASLLVKQFEFDMPKSCVVGIEFNMDSWKELKKESGTIKYFVYLDENSKKYDKLCNNLGSKLAPYISQWLAAINLEASICCSKAVEKQANKIIRLFLEELNGKTD